jgi:hypothetical protein
VLTAAARSQYNTIADGPDCQRAGDVLRCSDAGMSKIDDAQRLADISTGILVGGGVLVAVSAIVYVTAPYTKVTVAPVMTERGAGAVISGSF